MTTHSITASAPAVPRASSLSPRRWRILRVLLGLQVTALLALYLSGHWDAAEHAKGAVDRFWYPPHYGVYFAILAAALLSGAGLVLLVWGNPEPPFRALHRNLALTLVVMANVLSFTGAPADALWHEVFGIDLTVWSPPHLHILLGEVLAALACMVYFLPAPRPDDGRLESLGAPGAGRIAASGAVLVLALLLAAILVLEYEGGVTSREVMGRPRWAYPLLWSWFACFTFAIVSGSTRRLGMATAVALVYDLGRVAAVAFDRTVLDYAGDWGYPLVLAALVWDAVLWALTRRDATPSPRHWLIAGAAAAAVVVATTPLFFSALRVAPVLTVTPWLSYWLLALAAGVGGAAMGWWCGALLRRLRPAPATDASLGREYRSAYVWNPRSAKGMMRKRPGAGMLTPKQPFLPTSRVRWTL